MRIGKIFAVFVITILSLNSTYAVDNFSYVGECKNLGFNKSIPAPQDVAEGIAKREDFEKTGMDLHNEGKWLKSNCYLIHAANISSDHAVNLINTIGFNFAALGNHTKALEYFEKGTGYTFDLNGWVQKKKISPFNSVLNDPVYKKHENALYGYYKAMGLDIPQ